MEYIEMSAAAVSKGMFEKLIANDGSRIPFNANGAAPTGFRPMPVPLFSHGKPLSSMGMVPAPSSGSGSDLARRGGTSTFVTSGMSLNGSHMALGNVPNGSFGTIYLQVPGESGSSQQGEEKAEKGKRNKGEGGRGNRGSGTFSRKRTRAGQGDSLPTSEAMPDGSLSGGAATSAGRAVTVNGTRQLQIPNPEKGDKSISRRQSGNSARRGDKKQSQTVTTSVNDSSPPKLVEANGFPNNGSSGILDIYGLRTRAMDVSRLMVDIPLNDLLSGNFEVPSFYLKDNHEAKVEQEEAFEQQIESVLGLLPKRSVAGETHSMKVSDVSGSLGAKGPNNMKMMLDLQHPLHPEEGDIVPKMGKADKEMKSDLTLEANADEEGSTGIPVDGSSSTPVPSRFSLDNLPVHSVEAFLSRLKLMPSDPLPSLITQAGADCEMGAAADVRVGSDIVDVCHRNGSVPPLSFSHPHVGPLKADNGRYNPRIWIRAPVEINGRKGGQRLNGKEGSDGLGYDGSNSPNSRHGRIESKNKVQSPDAIQRSTSRASSMSPGRVDTARQSTADPSSSVKEEPRQVENAVGTSSGNPNPMEIDSTRLDNGSVIGGGADATNNVQAIPDGDRQRSGGEAVRPLEIPATLPGPQELDPSADRQGKPAADALPEVKSEKGEQKAVLKDGAKLDGGEANLVSTVPSASPAVDLKLNVRSPPPLQIDSSSSQFEQLTGTVQPSSPSAVAAARLLCSMANSAVADQDKTEGEKERRRRVFQPYPGAPAQKTVKSIRVSNSGAAAGDGGRDGKRSLDGGSVPPSKTLLSERRKSLSQVNDASEKPSYSSPRNSSGSGIPTGSRGGIHTGARSHTLSIKLDKVTARDSTKESTGTKELVGRGSSSLPPLSHGGPPLKNGHKGVKTNSYVHSVNSKGIVTAANLPKAPGASTTQRVGNGGTSSRSSRTVHNGSSPASHSLAPVSFKSSRQSIPESRQKTKSELAGRGGKPN
ncbi:unnamed protein product [Calypogeia fissa]